MGQWKKDNVERLSAKVWRRSATLHRAQPRDDIRDAKCAHAPVSLRRDWLARFLGAAGFGEVGGLKGCEWWGIGSLLRVWGLRVFESGHGRRDWGGIGQGRGEVLLEVLQKLGRAPKCGAVMHMASSRGLDNPHTHVNT